MTDIDTAIRAIQAHKRSLQERIDLLEESDRNADLVIKMLVNVINEIRVTGGNTTLKRSRIKHSLEFAAAHLGEDAA